MSDAREALPRLRGALAGREPERLSTKAEAGRPGAAPWKGRASVAVVLREGPTGPDLLFIQRVKRPGDPWSGHLAFPGGRIAQVETPRQAAERETREEVGLDLLEHEYLGQLDDTTGKTIPVVVSGFVYVVAPSAALGSNAEVADAFWVPLAVLCDPARHTERTFDIQGAGRVYPCVDLGVAGKPVLWGMTYRMAEQVAKLAGMAFGRAIAEGRESTENTARHGAATNAGKQPQMDTDEHGWRRRI